VSDDTPLFRAVRIVLPCGDTLARHVYSDLQSIKVPLIDPSGLGYGYLHLARHEAAGMVWYQVAGQA